MVGIRMRIRDSSFVIRVSSFPHATMSLRFFKARTLIFTEAGLAAMSRARRA